MFFDHKYSISLLTIFSYLSSVFHEATMQIYSVQAIKIRQYTKSFSISQQWFHNNTSCLNQRKCTLARKRSLSAEIALLNGTQPSKICLFKVPC